MRVLLVSVLLVSSWGCHYYEDFRLKKTQADVQEERAELMRAYRECLKKYESEPQKSREFCAPYTQSLREIEVRGGR
jgi:predicted ABC-class ATPase